ncbi:MAG: zinc-binding dehydrogenase, partial [Paracoccaceae bacterium]|nr:zinc-binding dehydrogenase [Paracoccaceae bacterium]
QWARSEGITLIGTAGTDEKCKLAVENGATHCINYTTENFEERVKELTGGKGVDVVMDSIGKDTFEGSLNCLKPFGMMISFGNATGPVEGVALNMLAAKGSLKVTRPSVFTHIADFERCQEMGKHLFEKVSSGAIKVQINQRYPLADAARAQTDLEARKTTGSTVLIP